VTQRLNILAGVAMATLVIAGGAHAAEKYKQIGTIAVPGKPFAGFDISYVDQKTQRYLITDRSNGTVDMFDAKTDKYIGSIPGFVGAKETNGKPDFGISGPAGVLAYGDRAWAGDGDSTGKEIDLKTMKVIATVSTGGKQRFDEIAYDPKDHVLVGGNGDDDPPFAAFISTTQHKLIAKISFPHLTDGLEQPVYSPAAGLFYEAVPEIDKNPQHGGVAVMTPQGKLVKIMPVDNCNPHGLTLAPHGNLFLGCSAAGKHGMPPIFVVMNAKSGKVVATIEGAGGADEVWYSPKQHRFFAASAGLGGIFVIDARTNKLIQKISIQGGRTHSVAVSDYNRHVFVPETLEGGGCGCIAVFAPEK